MAVAFGLSGCAAFSTGSRQAPSPRAAAVGPVAFVAAYPRSAPANVAEVSPAGGRLRPVTRGGPDVIEAAWSPDGSELVFARRLENLQAGNTNGYVEVFVARRGARPRLIRRCALACDARSFAWSPDGRRIAFVTNIRSKFTGTAGEIAVMNADGSGFHAVCDESRCGQGLDDPRWSPDGSKLVFSNMGVIGFPSVGILPSRVWVAGADGSDPHPLTQPHCRPGRPPLLGCAYDSAAAWSPDGRWIAFSRLYERFGPPPHAAPRTVIELMRPDGSDLHELAACTGILCNQVMPPVWSPDGARIAYAPRVEHGPTIVLLTPGSRLATVRTCTPAACATPDDVAWSPTGDALAFLAGAKVQTAFVIPARGRGMHAIGRGVRCCLAWLPRR